MRLWGFLGSMGFQVIGRWHYLGIRRCFLLSDFISIQFFFVQASPVIGLNFPPCVRWIWMGSLSEAIPQEMVTGNNYLALHVYAHDPENLPFSLYYPYTFQLKYNIRKHPIYLCCGLFPSYIFRLPLFCFPLAVFVHTHQGFRLLLGFRIYTFQHVNCGAFIGVADIQRDSKPSLWKRAFISGDHHFHATYHILCIYPFHLLIVFFRQLYCYSGWIFTRVFCGIMAFAIIPFQCHLHS